MRKHTLLRYSMIGGALLAALVLLGGAASAPRVDSDCPGQLTAWCERIGDVTPVIVELEQRPAVVEAERLKRAGGAMDLGELEAYMRTLIAEQDRFLASLAKRGVHAKLRETDVAQPDGSVRHVEYRLTYTLNGIVAYVATADLDNLRALPEVAQVSRPARGVPALDHAIDYSLGVQPTVAARRLAVYGATEELSPAATSGHPETPREVAVDGLEGQGMYIAIIDSGVDWRHPMFGGTGNSTPLPRISNVSPSPEDNRKVVYYYSLADAGDPTDDFGHGTLVASTAAGYRVDGNTPPIFGFGTGTNPPDGIGPTPNGEVFHGMAPQAKILAYKVCNIAGTCTGDIELAIEDAASPVTLIASGTPDPQMLAKPVADVINLSLGSTSGDSASSTSRAANNAALAGTIVVASAGNEGEDDDGVPVPGSIGAPGAATLPITVGASLDPGSVAGIDGLLAAEVPTDPEIGAASEANTIDPARPQGLQVFPVAGGGFIPESSLSAHFVYYDQTCVGCLPPTNLTNRIAIVNGMGAFANIANMAAVFDPAAILILTDVESATALVVVSAGDPAEGIPTFTMTDAKAMQLGLALVPAEHDVVSTYPIRLGASVSLAAFESDMAGFSSFGPNDHANAAYRVIKPDVTAPGVAVAGAATPDGLPDETIGLASTTGYTQASGTSFSSPITAGSMALIRQHVRDDLGFDSTDPMDFDDRFEALTIAKALLMNAATNLRTGDGMPDPDPAPTDINHMGAGHINIDGAIQAKAVFLSPTTLFDTAPNEYDPRADQAAGNLTVLIPSTSFANVPVVNVLGSVVRTHDVVIRDVTGQGGGTYDLSFQDNRNINTAGFTERFTASANSAAPITSVVVPTNGSVTFSVRIIGDGNQISPVGKEFQWYATAEQSGTGRRLRMPFYYRAVAGSTNDTDHDGVSDFSDNCLTTVNTNQADADADGVGDACDNCTEEANPSQCNTNDDRFGNHCDADLDNNGIVNQIDLGVLRNNLGATGDNDADLDCNGVVNQIDLGRLRDDYGQPPGPSGL